jgi:hypothetical protein
MSAKFVDKQKLFMKGMKRHIASKEMEDGNRGIIKKKKMGFNEYEKRCELRMKEEDKEFIFVCCFLRLEWNLMAGLERIVFAHLFHITWEDNLLVFCFAKSNTDQAEQNKDQMWHVYTAPDSPITCPVLALVCYIFANLGLTNRDRDNSNESADNFGQLVGHLFQGGNQFD